MTATVGFELEARPDVDGVDTSALGKPITGPRAFTGDWIRFWHLTFNIAKTQWKLRFFGSVLGYLWQLIRPLLLFGVIYVFFTKIAVVTRGQPSGPGQPGQFYGTQLLAGIVLFTFFQEATANAVRGVVENEALVRKIQFPRLAIPLASVMVAVFNLCLNLIVVMIFGFSQGVRPMVSWVELPLVLMLLIVLAAGFAMLLSALFVYFRDIQPIWEVVLQVMFYAAPVMIPMWTVVTALHGGLLRAYTLDPLEVAFSQFRHIMITHAVPGAAAYFGWTWVLASIALVIGVLLLGFWVFNRTAPHVAENL